MGDSVEWDWVNGGHTTTSNAGSGVAWNAPIDMTHTSFTQSFGSAGEFSYHCNIHPASMKGTVVVGTVFDFSSSSFSVSETAGMATITVNRVGSSSGTVSVHYATSDGTATAGTDYTDTSGTLNWGDGVSGGQTFNVPVTNDNTSDGNETVHLALSSPGGSNTALGNTASATLTIMDPAPPPPAGNVQFSSSSYSASESSGSATITVDRVGGSTGAASVNYATSDGTATAGIDYTAASGTLNWAGGDAAAKTVNLTLSSATGSSMGSPSSATLTISDSSAFQPDALIKLSTDKRFIGGGVISATAAGETRTVKTAAGTRRTFLEKFVNTGSSTDTFTLSGQRSSRGFAVKYLAGTTVITSRVVAGTYSTGPIAAGASKVIKVVIAVARTARAGAVKKVLVSAVSQGDDSVRDAVRAVVKVLG